MHQSKIESDKEFLTEAEEILYSFGNELVVLESTLSSEEPSPSSINNIFRAAHTLKGLAGVYEHSGISTVSHCLEDLLDSLRLGKTVITEEIFASILKTHELLQKMVASRGLGDFTDDIEEIRGSLGMCIRTSYSPEDPNLKESWKYNGEFSGMLTEYEVHRISENCRLGRNLLVITSSFSLDNFDRDYMALTESLGDISEVIATLPSASNNMELMHFEILVGTEMGVEELSLVVNRAADGTVRKMSLSKEAEVGGVPAQVPKERKLLDEDDILTVKSVSNTVRVDIAKLDSIMNIVGELSIVKRSLGHIVTELKSASGYSFQGIELSRVEKALDRKLSDLRDGILGVRMVPIGQLFSRFDPMIRRLTRESGKEVTLLTYGDDTHLDKLVVEELADPLLHIIRNVIDHAVELPEKREEMGKDRVSTIRVSAYQQGNHIIVEVRDDGSGVNLNLVKERGVEKGLINESLAKRISDKEVLELIFTPGFTTTDRVSEVSGRGVGLDVVKENITRLSGVIDIETYEGKGTRFIMTIPVTLAIFQALIVKDGEVSYAVPLTSILEVREIDASMVEDVDSRNMITIDDRTMAAIKLSTFMGDKSLGEEDAREGTLYGLVVGVAEHRLCIVVESLLEEQDVVIKPLSRLMDTPGIAGAADMGEGGTILVLDVTGILDIVLKDIKPSSEKYYKM